MTTPNTNKQPQDLEKELEGKMQDIRTQEIEDSAKQLAQKNNLPYLNLRAFPVDINAVILVPETEAHSAHLVAISKTGKRIKIAISEPENPTTQTTIKKLRDDGYTVDLFVVSEIGLANGWKRYQLKNEIKESALGIISIKDTDIGGLAGEIKNISDLKEKLTGMPVGQILSTLISGALKIGASDIHFEPEEKNIRLRYRLDGVLYDVVNLALSGYPQLLSRIKLQSGLKINVNDIPQDGRFTIRQETNDIEVRVSILPGSYGENIVMRILDPRTIRQKLEDLGMREDMLVKIKKLLEKTTGALLTTGPTGSGKTTTLYAFVKYINSPDIKIITIEDPVEYHIEGISQTQVDSYAGYTFASGLRSIVRQDPDAILVGEIRDTETAEIAMQAALTGHLVFSTLHTNNAAGALPRLIDLGVKTITLAPAINAVMAQRLVRKLCPECKTKKKTEPKDLELLKQNLVGLAKDHKLPAIDESLKIYYPGKCEKCNSTGYTGRIGVYELFEMDADIEKFIIKSPSISEIEEIAESKGMIKLLQDGLLKVIDGLTSIEEVMRVIGE